MYTSVRLLLAIVLFGWKVSCGSSPVAFVNPSPTLVDGHIHQYFPLGSVLDIKWTSTTDDPLSLGLIQPSTAHDTPLMIFGKSF